MSKKLLKPDSNEFKLHFKKKLSPHQRSDIVRCIKKSPLFSGSYRLQGNTWYELRASNNQDQHHPANCSLLILEDFMYIMRGTNEHMWDDLSQLEKHLKDELEKVSWSVENYWQ